MLVRSLILCSLVATLVGALTGDVAEVIAGGLANGVPALSYAVSSPFGVAVGANGTILTAAVADFAIRQLKQNTGRLYTIAGGICAAYAGDGAPATLARFNIPHDVVYDAVRNITYISDKGSHTIRRIDSSGNISTYAGTGGSGSNGDGYPANAYRFQSPMGMSLDPATGTLFVADLNNNRVRAILLNRTIVTFAGSGGVNAVIPDGTLATQAGLSMPEAVAWAPTLQTLFYLYHDPASGTYANLIGAVAPNGTVYAVAGLPGSSCPGTGDNGPAIAARLCASRIAWNNVTNSILLADVPSSSIRQINMTSGIITTLINTYTPTRAGVEACPFASPTAITVGSDGSVYFSMVGLHRVCQWDPRTNVMWAIMGNGLAGEGGNGFLARDAGFYAAAATVYDAKLGRLLISDGGANIIRSITSNGYIERFAGIGGPVRSSLVDGNTTIERVNYPTFMCLEADGSLLYTEQTNHAIRRIYPNQTVVSLVGTGSGGFNGDGWRGRSTTLQSPTAVIPAVGPWRFVFADSGNHRIRAVDANGLVRTIAGNGSNMLPGVTVGLGVNISLQNPQGLAADTLTGDIYIGSAGHAYIWKLFPNGTMVLFAGGGVSTADFQLPLDARLLGLTQLSFDSATKVLYFADTGTNRVRMVKDNNVSTVAGNGSTDVTRCGYAVDVPLKATNVSFCQLTNMQYDATLRALFVIDVSQRKVYMVRLQLTSDSSTKIISSAPGTTASPNVTDAVLPVTFTGFLYGLTSMKLGVLMCTIQVTNWNTAQVTCPNTFHRDLTLTLGGTTVVQPLILESATYPSINVVWAGGPVTWGIPIRLAAVGIGMLDITASVTFVNSLTGVWTSCLALAPEGRDALTCKVGMVSTIALNGGGGFRVALDFPVGNAYVGVQSAITMQFTMAKLSIAAPLPTTINPFIASTLAFSLPDVAPYNVDGLCSECVNCRKPAVYLGTTPLNCSTSNNQTFQCPIPQGANARRRVVFSICDTLSEVTSDGKASNASRGSEVGTYIYQPYITDISVLLDAGLMSATVSMTGQGLSDLDYALSQLLFDATLDGTVFTCTSFVVSSDTSATCVLSPFVELVSLFVRAGPRVNALAATATAFQGPQLANLTLPVVKMLQAPVIRAIVPSDVLSGTEIAILGNYFTPLTGISVWLGSASCAPTLVTDTTIVCTVPTVSPIHSTQYPLFSVRVMTQQPLTSNGLISIRIAADCTLSIGASNYTALPSGVTSIFPVVPSVPLTVSGSGRITCTAALASTSTSCFNSTSPSDLLAGNFPSLTVASIVGDTQLTASNATSMVLTNLGVSAPGGCTVNVSVTCRDDLGRAVESTVNITVGKIQLSWLSGSVPTLLPSSDTQAPMAAVLNVPVSVSLASIQASMSCVAGVTFQADTVSESLSAASLLASTTSFSLAGNSTGSLRLEFGSVSLESLYLGTWAYYCAECTWLPTLERFRLPRRVINIAAVDITLLTGDTINVHGYTYVNVPIALTSSIQADISASNAACSFVSTNPIPAGTRLSAESSSASYTALSNGTITPPPKVLLEALPGSQLDVYLSCVLWGQLYQSPRLRFNVVNYTVVDVSGATPILAVPSSSSVPGSSLLFPPLVISSAAQVSLTCSASIASAACPPRPATYGQPLSYALTPSLVGATSASATAPETGDTFLSFADLAVSSPSGCNLVVSVQCTDGASRTAVPLLVYISALNISGAWNTSSSRSTTLMHGVPTTYIATLNVDTTALPAGSNRSALSMASVTWTCNIGIFEAYAPELFGEALEITSAVFSASNILAYATTSPTVWSVDLAGTDCVACAPLVNYTVRTECHYVPTGERIRLPAFNVSYLGVSLGTNLTTSQYNGYESYSGTVQLSFSTTQSLLSTASLQEINAHFTGVAATCNLVQVNASSSLVSVRSLFNNGLVIPADGIPVSFTWQVIGPPLQSLFARVQCTLSNGDQVHTPAYHIRIAAFVVALHASATPIAMLPSSRTDLMYLPPVTVTAPASGKTICTISVVATQCTLTLVGTTSMQADASIGSSFMVFDQVAASGPMGCQGILVATCSDSAGRSNTSSPGLPVYMARWALEWESSTLNQFQVPVGLGQLQELRTTARPVSNLPFSNAAPYIECTTIISTSTMALPLLKPLKTYVSTALSYKSVTAVGLTTAFATFTGLSMDGAAFNTTAYVLSECLWKTSQEVIGTLSLPVRTVAPVIQVYMPPSFAVQGYTLHSLNASIDGLVGNVPSFMLPAADCRLVALQSSSTVVKLQSSGMSVTDGGTMSLVGTYTVEGPPGSWTNLAVTCSLWNGVVSSRPFNVSLLTFQVYAVSLPREYIPSDTTTAWPVQTLPIIRIQDAQQQPVINVACTLSLATAVAGMGIFSTQTLSNLHSNATGHVTFPAFSVRGDYRIGILTFKVVCTRDSGEAMPPLTWNASVIPLRQAFCSPPLNTQSSQVALPPFSVVITTQTITGSCAAIAYPHQLPPTVCDIRVLAQANLAGNGSTNSSTFFQGTATTPAANIATFDQFTITAPQNATLSFGVVCQSGGVPLLPPLTFDVTILGCAAGSEAIDSMCNKCGGTTFSFGGVGSSCVSCPPVGATCTNGILTLLPGFYRPPAQSYLSFDGATELHACTNSEACLVDAEQLTYSCTEGYSGPLCSVCDEAMDYVRNINDCRPCWNQGVSAFFVIVAIAVVLSGIAVLTLRPQSAHSEAAILFRITINYLQVIGILRTFTAGGTNVYHNLMGWVDAVASSPLAVSAVQCLFRANFFNQLLFTSILPLLVLVIAAMVSIIAYLVAACRGSAKSGVRTELWARFNMQRVTGTALIAAFILYVPTTMQSLRALDCYPSAIDGVTYLRSDMQVACGSAMHSKAVSLGIAMLVLLTCCLPLVAAWGVRRAGAVGSVWAMGLWSFFLAGYRQTRPSQPSRAEASSNTVVGTLHRIQNSLQPSSCVWWECVQMLRKAGIVIAAVVFHTPHVQSVATTCWLLLFLFWQLQEQPYQRRLFNVLDIWSQAACVFTSYISTTLLEFNASDPTNGANTAKLEKWQWAATVLLLAVNLSTVIGLGMTWITLLRKKESEAAVMDTKPVRADLLGLAGTTPRPSVVADGGYAQSNPLRRPSVLLQAGPGAPMITSPQRRPASLPRAK